MKVRIKRSTALMWLCWLVYACSYLGKVNYSANITQFESFFKVSHAEAGMVSTFFFFAYGAGQIFNGVFCIKYNIKYVVFGGLLLSAGANFGITVLNDFTVIKYLWMLNGVGLSVLWPTIIRLLSETLKKEDMARASVVMGTTVATGTLIIYGLSSVFALFEAFKLSFLVPAIVLPIVGCVWLSAFGKLTKKDDSLDISETGTNKKCNEQVCVERSKKEKSGIKSTVILLGFFAVATNLVADGLTTWVPSILKETYGLNDSLSILLTLCLPLLAIFGNLFAVNLYKKTKSFVGNCGVLFFVAGSLMVAIIGLLQTDIVVLTIVCFAGVRFASGSSNSTITSICPLYMKGKVNSGLLAGMLNGCCYLGSTISSYGLGVVADYFGWNAVFYLLLGVCVAVVLASCIFEVIRRAAKN